MPANRFVWLTLAGACVMSWFYFGDIWRAPDSYLFTSSGDGLQGYYQSMWHVRNDTTYWQQHSLNYPFGESIFFTGGQPLLSNTARLLGVHNYIVGASNVFLLSSGILAAVFVCLIFLRLGVSGIYSSVFSIGIVMLSQQWERFGGHFALSVMWAIPVLLWLMMRFFDSLKGTDRSGWLQAFILSVVLFILGLIQFYYLFFAAVLMAGFTIVYLLRSGIAKKGRFLVQAILLFALPFALLQLLMHLSSEVADRTAIPWGFLIYRSSLMSYLYPFGMPYEQWFTFLKPNASLEWEGLAFIGFSTCVAMLIVAVYRLRIMVKKISVERTPSAMPALALAAAFCVLVSLAFPFNIGFENLLYQLGSVQQFRGIGRFAFVAYYPILIGAFAGLLLIAGKGVRLHATAVSVCLLLLLEGHARMHEMSRRMSNMRGETLAATKEDFSFIDTSRFQAIHPIPYVHVGSENIGFSADDEAMHRLYNASLALSMPSTATVMSRTSIGQSFLSCGMASELMEVPPIVSLFPDLRPLLVLADSDHLTKTDRRLLQFADSLSSDGRFTWYALPLSAFEDAVRANASEAETISKTCIYGTNGTMCDDSLQQVVMDDSTYHVRFSRGWKRLFERPLMGGWENDTLKISFWVTDFKRDLIPRSIVEFIQYDEKRSVVDYQTEFMGKRMVGLRGNDALIEYSLVMNPKAQSISMSVENKLIQGQSIQINSILIRSQRVNCRILRGENESLNNRNYSR